MRGLRYRQFLRLFPLVRFLSAMARVTLYRMVRDGRLIAARDVFTGSVVMVPAHVLIPHEEGLS